MVGKREIGLLVDSKEESPFLNNGIIFDTLSESGNTPVVII